MPNQLKYEEGLFDEQNDKCYEHFLKKVKTSNTAFQAENFQLLCSTDADKKPEVAVKDSSDFANFLKEIFETKFDLDKGTANQGTSNNQGTPKSPRRSYKLVPRNGESIPCFIVREMCSTETPPITVIETTNETPIENTIETIIKKTIENAVEKTIENAIERRFQGMEQRLKSIESILNLFKSKMEHVPNE
mgnify:CR=1 FL=1